jgi:hypothetical protein
MHQALASPWGRLFQNWGTVRADDQGFADIGGEDATLKRTGVRAFLESLRILWQCLKEAPEFTTRHRRMVRSSEARSLEPKA